MINPSFKRLELKLLSVEAAGFATLIYGLTIMTQEGLYADAQNTTAHVTMPGLVLVLIGLLLIAGIAVTIMRLTNKADSQNKAGADQKQAHNYMLWGLLCATATVFLYPFMIFALMAGLKMFVLSRKPENNEVKSIFLVAGALTIAASVTGVVSTFTVVR